MSGATIRSYWPDPSRWTCRQKLSRIARCRGLAVSCSSSAVGIMQSWTACSNLFICLLSGDGRGRAVVTQHVGHIAPEVFEDRQHEAVGDRGAVQRVDDLRALLAFGAVTDAEASRLEVGRVRGRGHLAVALLMWEPGLDVVLLRGRGAEAAGGDVHDAIGQAERTDDLLLDREQPLVLVARSLRLAEDEQLDLVELVDPEHPAGVLARGAGLAP